MKYLKKWPHYTVLGYMEYDNILYDNMGQLKVKVYSLDYYEQESIINLFKSKFKVSESLDDKLFIDNEVVIGFNRPSPEVSCWLNIRTFRKMPPTKKWIQGRIVDKFEHEISITKLDDEWFLVRGVMVDGGHSEEVKCDQSEGLIQYFKDRFKL